MGAAKPKLLIGSPIFQKPAILEAFLQSLDRIDTDGLDVAYLFVDDNTDGASKALLADFQARHAQVALLPGEQIGTYRCDEVTHHWSQALMEKVGAYKDRILEHAVGQGFDGVFLIDSDLLIHRRLIQHLMACGKEIVSEIFWTKWTPQSVPLPNVWLYDQYGLVPSAPSEQLSEDEKNARTWQFLSSLRVPGLYRVGGLGACTLISRAALLKGVRFAPIDNLRLLRGEDRFFCVRAAALGLELFVDTHHPAYHIYRESDLAGVPAYLLQNT
ncbi:MAG: hypothetical protein GXX99_02585 [Clostridiales bacterium]|nr:hypothetical protein [Clostridiales bacterium]